MFVAAESRFIPHVMTATTAEAMAMLHGLELTNSLGYTTIKTESDSLEVIQLRSGQTRVWNDATTIYDEIMAKIGMVGKVEFSHCGRDVNTAAHGLARECFNSRISCIWVDEPPSFILQSLLNDVIVI